MSKKIHFSLAAYLLAAPTPLPSALPDDQLPLYSSEKPPKYGALHRLKHQLSPLPKFQAKGKYVGELQEKWQFPSDHLPIGMRFEENNFLSWNVLDSRYMSWVEQNSQGLKRSMLMDEHIYLPGSKLTIRDEHVIQLLLETITHPTNPRSALCLQECGEAFLAALKTSLPSHFILIEGAGKAILVDLSCFEIVEAKEVPGIFSCQKERTLQDVTLKRRDNGKELRLLNGHLPGDPTKPSRLEFTQYLAKTFNPSIATLAMGDMNFDEIEMDTALQEAFDGKAPFSLYSPYCTNITPHEFNSKAIDHFFVYSPKDSPVELSNPNQILAGLDKTTSLLE